MGAVSRQEEEEISDLLLLNDLVWKLPVRERAVVGLRAAGFTQAECGQILGLTRAAIGYIFKRAVERMHRFLFSDDTESDVGA